MNNQKELDWDKIEEVTEVLLGYYFGNLKAGKYERVHVFELNSWLEIEVIDQTIIALTADGDRRVYELKDKAGWVL